ncbi:hypothetical protein U0070_003685 [Myodes glareolus]|uniref:Uncharacterized protein n=1 Tax=Myodes glareolus TaxID=447135 RepID=A0AAW0H2I6_MYOGA
MLITSTITTPSFSHTSWGQSLRGPSGLHYPYHIWVLGTIPENAKFKFTSDLSHRKVLKVLEHSNLSPQGHY